METSENRYQHKRFFGNRRHRAGWVFLGIIGFTALALLFGLVVLSLWNWLMPVIFHLGVITYWQAIGLAILGRLLFGGMHHGGPHRHMERRSGPWNHMRGMHGRKDCRDHDYGMKWSHYDRYWEEEGEKNFNDYLERNRRKPVGE